MYKRGDSSTSSVAHIEEHLFELDSFQKTIMEMINDMSEDFWVSLDIVRNKITDVNMRVNLTIASNGNPTGNSY